MQLSRPAALEELRERLHALPGVQVLNEPEQRRYPTALERAGQDDVVLRRSRPDPSAPDCWNLWIVGDNVRKGAALNAVQIAELL